MLPLKHLYITKADVQPYDLPTLLCSRRISNGQIPNLYYDAIIQPLAQENLDLPSFTGQKHPGLHLISRQLLYRFYAQCCL
jgi:hypothetical protein